MEKANLETLFKNQFISDMSVTKTESGYETILNMGHSYTKEDGDITGGYFYNYETKVDNDKALDFFKYLFNESIADDETLIEFKLDKFFIETDIKTFLKYLETNSIKELVGSVTPDDTERVSEEVEFPTDKVKSVSIGLNSTLYSDNWYNRFTVTFTLEDDLKPFTNSVKITATDEKSLVEAFALLRDISRSNSDLDLQVEYDNIIYTDKVQKFVNVNGNFIAFINGAKASCTFKE